MEERTTEKGQNGVLDQIEALLMEENNGEVVGFILVTVPNPSPEKSRVETRSNMKKAQLPRLLHLVTSDLVKAALTTFEQTAEALEYAKSLMGRSEQEGAEDA